MLGGFGEIVILGIFGTLSAFADVMLQGYSTKEDQAKRRAEYEAYKKSPNYGKTFGEILKQKR